MLTRMSVARRVPIAIAATIALVVPAGPRPASVHAQSPGRLEAAVFAGLKWRSIGPAATGGRVDDIAVSRTRDAPDAIYVATASGGLFKSTNQGTSWAAIFDRVDAMMSVGDVAVAPSNPSVVWAGTGEANNRQSSSWGDGIYKSLDAGRTWQSMGLRDTHHVGRILVHPANPDVVYVAALGHLWGPNTERGVFKTSDGGRTWTRALFVDENTGATDLVMDPADPQTLFAAMYQRQRKAWGFNGGGPGSAIYRTRDGGATWTKLRAGLPAGDKGRIGLDVFARDGHLVYAVVEAAGRDSGLYRTSDGGDTWEQLGTLNPRPMYYSQVRADPRDRNRVYLLGSNRGFYVSDDGGRSFRDVFSTVHSEDHALWIDPDDTNHLIVGGDGGVSISWDRGETWLFRDNLPIAQFYEISADTRDPYYVCGGLQDNGLWCMPSATHDRNGISNADAYNIGGGDGFHAEVDPADPNTIYIDSQEGRATRVTLPTRERQAIAPLPERRPKPGERQRWNWNTPLVVSAADPSVIYIGSNVLFRSPDRGVSWKPISPDLTARIDRDSLTMMGAAVPPRALSRHDGQSSYGTLTTIGESPLNPKLLYTGSDDGQVQMTRDGGATWTNVTARIPGLPPNTYVSSVVASRHAVGRVYVTFDGHFNDDYRPYVFVSEDFGRTWRPLLDGLRQTSVHRLREHPRNPRLLAVGHERGIDVSIDGGATWAALNANMPNVPVNDLLFHPRDNDLIAGTHGRGIWILDDAGPLEALAADVLASSAYLMPIRPARIRTIYGPQAWFGAGHYFAPNPEFGALISYFVRPLVPETVEIQVRDTSGQLVRTLRHAARAGLNRIAWDLRMDPPLDDSEPAVDGSAAGSAPAGPFVLPGTYVVTVKAGGRELRRDVEVAGDPRTTFSTADRSARQDVLLDIYGMQRALGQARTMLRTVAGETAALRRDVGSGGARRGVRADGVERLDRTIDRLARLIREASTELSTLGTLGRAIEAYSGPPTVDQRRQLDWVFGDVVKTIDEVNQTVQADLPPLYSALSRQDTWSGRARAIPPPVRRR